MGVLDKLVAGVARAAGPLKCPRCGEKAGRVESTTMARCGECGYRGSLIDWVPASGGEAEAVVDADRPPEGTKIVRRELGGGAIAWEVPPSGRSGGLMFFAVLWNGFMTVFTVAMGGAMLKGEMDGDAPAWLALLFIGLFWAVGLGMLYAALRMKYSRHLLVVDGREVVLVRSLFGRKKRRALRRDGLRSVEKREFYQQNYKPVYGIEIRGSDGKLRLGTTLSEEEKDWLVADCRRVLWPPAEDPEEAARAPDYSGGLRLRMPVAGPFTVELPPARGASQWAGLLVGLLVIGGFIAVGILLMKDAGFFRIMWLGLNGLFALALLAGLRNAIRNVGVTIRVTGDRGEIRVQRMKGPRMLSEKRMPRKGAEVRAGPSGTSGGTRMMRVQLVGPEHTIPVVRWRAEHEVEGMVSELKAALGG